MGMTINDLKEQRIWICWKYIEEDGKRKKKPCAADGQVG